MPSKLTVYKGACAALGERGVASLSETSAMRRRLDDAWDSGVVKECLQSGLWNHAIRTVRLEYSSDIEPDFGYTRAFEKSEDWLRTIIVASDPYLRAALDRYKDEVRIIYADLNVIYASFVSDDENYGMDLGNWPPKFNAYVEHALALKAARATTGSKVDVDDLDVRTKRKLLAARSTDAMDQPTQSPRQGSWAAARVNGSRTC